MTTSYPAVNKATAAWVDVVAANAALSGVPITLQNNGNHNIRIFFGGTSAPASPLDGTLLGPGERFVGSAANIWIYGIGGYSAMVN